MVLSFLSSFSRFWLGLTKLAGGWSCLPATGGGCRVDDPNGKVVAANLLMILCIIAWAGSSATVTFTLIKWCGGLRIDEETDLRLFR